MMTNWISAPDLDEFTDYWYDTANANIRDWYCIIDLHGGPTSAITQVDHASTPYAHRNALWKFELYDRVANNVIYPVGGESFLMAGLRPLRAHTQGHWACMSTTLILDRVKVRLTTNTGLKIMIACLRSRQSMIQPRYS